MVSAIMAPEAKDHYKSPEEFRIERDRKLTLDYVRGGESKRAKREIINLTGIHPKTLNRAIQRQLAWARDALKDEIKGSARTGDSPNTKVEPQCTNSDFTSEGSSTPRQDAA